MQWATGGSVGLCFRAGGESVWKVLAPMAIGLTLIGVYVNAGLQSGSLVDHGARATVQEIVHGRQAGARFTDRAGTSHLCRTTNIRAGDTILYDPNDPEFCWPEAYAGMPVPGDLIPIGLGLAFFVLGAWQARQSGL